MRRELWIFGYGSLLWRPSFRYAELLPARVDGWARRFWQGSTDHRGRPGAPGRVVTLLREVEAVCWGMAYRIEPERADEVLRELDWREKGGYARQPVRLHFRGARQASDDGLMYLATPDNPNYLGPAPLERIAEQVRDSSGPSGSNLEYVLRLAEELRAIQAEDPHVSALERMLKSDGRD